MSNQEWQALADRISLWMREQVRSAGAKGIVFGLSGGVDSSVVAALAKMAMGDNALGLLLPCHSSPNAEEHALLVAKQFGIKTEAIDLSPAYDMLLQSFPAGEGLATANIRPRLRMIALYYVANSRNYLVAGTGNKTECAVGYFTKWGDGSADIMPIADLYKYEVRELARELGVPDVIIEKPPTADLWPGQTDEGEIGISYADLDGILVGLEKGDVSSLDPEAVAKVKALIASSEHKRRLAPVFRKVDG